MDYNRTDYKIANIDLAREGRLRIDFSSYEMPGLTQLKNEYRNTKPLKGAKISGSLGVTTETAVYLETLKELGAEIRWCSSNLFSTQDDIAAALVAANSAKIFAWKAETNTEFWWCIYQTFLWENGDLPDLIIDDGGEVTDFIHYGYYAEKEFEITGSLPGVEDLMMKDEDCYELIILILSTNKGFFKRLVKKAVGLCEHTTSGVAKLDKLFAKNKLLYPVISVNDSLTKSKFDNRYGCRHSLIDGLNRATDVLVAGKKVVILGFGDVGKGCAEAMKAAGAKVYITEIDPICALQACMEGFNVVKVESALDADIFITAIGGKDEITVGHMEKMKNNAIVCSMGTDEVEIDVKGLRCYPGMIVQEIKPQLEKFIFPDGHSLVIPSEGNVLNLGNATGHPPFVMSLSFTNQVLAQMEFWNNRNTGKFKKELMRLPKNLDEQVARLHLDILGAELTELTDEQAIYIGVSKLGPFKNDSYRY